MKQGLRFLGAIMQLGIMAVISNLVANTVKNWTEVLSAFVADHINISIAILGANVRSLFGKKTVVRVVNDAM